MVGVEVKEEAGPVLLSGYNHYIIKCAINKCDHVTIFQKTSPAQSSSRVLVRVTGRIRPSEANHEKKVETLESRMARR